MGGWISVGMCVDMGVVCGYGCCVCVFACGAFKTIIGRGNCYYLKFHNASLLRNMKKITAA